MAKSAFVRCEKKNSILQCKSRSMSKIGKNKNTSELLMDEESLWYESPGICGTIY